MSFYQEALEKLNEVNLYYQGAFWIVGNSLTEIKKGNFNLLIGSKIPTDYYGDYLEKVPSKNQLTHRNLWFKPSLDNNLLQYSFDYFPRGRVAIDQGTAYIHLNSKCSTNKILTKIIETYCLDGLRIVYDYNNEYQGSHYDFELK